jgi:hypothetical protein
MIKMKRLSTIIMALALVLGMSQCKKQETPTNGNSGEKVYVTLNVSNGESIAVNVDNGGRHAVAPNLGVIQFRDTDVLYVGHDGKYIGQLTYNNGAFSGELNAPTSNDFLHFYFLGGKTPTTTPTAGTTTSFNISIDNQTSNLPVLCYGHSSQPYTGTGSNYTAVLEYKCALVRFNLNKETDYKCTLSNMPTEATISFATTAGDGFTPIAKTSTTGTIDLYREEGNTGVRWAILLPGTNLSAAGNVSGAPSGTLNANQFINSGITLINPEFAAPDPANAVKTSGGVMTQFSVSSTQKVYFSRANLRFGVNAGQNGSTNPGWSLHATQLDEHEDYYGQHNPSSQNPSSDMDRICWGRLSNDGGNFAYPPGGNWIYPDNSDLTGDNDWGSVLTGDGNNNWRMLTASEWNYLFNGTARGTRRFLKVRIGIPMALANIYGSAGFRFGVLLLPDNYDGAGLSMKDQDNKKYSFNNSNKGFVLMKKLETDGSDDVSKMLNAGAVFLPGLGYRNGDDQVIQQYQQYYYYNMSDWQDYGYYWSSTHVNSYGVNETDRMAKVLYFDDSSVNTGLDMFRRRGCCVRLVWDAN